MTYNTRLLLLTEGCTIGLIAFAMHLAARSKLLAIPLVVIGIAAYAHTREQTTGFDNADMERAAEDIADAAMGVYEQAREDGYEEGPSHASHQGSDGDKRGFR